MALQRLVGNAGLEIGNMSTASDRIIVPLDVSHELDALALVDALREHVGFFKVGFELIYSVGTNIIKKIEANGGRVFLDCKLLDIPNTVAGAARAITHLGVGMFNVHTLGGIEMMKAAVDVTAREAAAAHVPKPLVLGVTILTSLDRRTVNEELWIPGTVEDIVAHLAHLSVAAGVDGVIASPLEITAIRRAVPGITVIVTPGVRPEWAAAQDQKRVMTPGEAVRLGASHLVIGRPITKPPASIGGPVDAAKVIAEEIAAAVDSKEN